MISRVRRTQSGTDTYGDPTYTETVTEIPEAFYAPRRSTDTDQLGRDGIVVGLDLYYPYGWDLDRSDFVDVDGERYRIIGEIAPWRSPFTGWEAGAVVSLERGEG